jgi:hypothetical protein
MRKALKITTLKTYDFQRKSSINCKIVKEEENGQN